MQARFAGCVCFDMSSVQDVCPFWGRELRWSEDAEGSFLVGRGLGVGCM